MSKSQPKPPSENKSLIEWLIQYRKDQGWTQGEAAKRLEISVWSLRSYEQGARTPNGTATLKILDLLGALK